jgi:hypothetical protein
MSGSSDAPPSPTGDVGATPKRARKGPPKASGPRPPGIRDQIGSTKAAAIKLAMAHVDLAKAEMAAIAGQIARVAALLGAAIGLLISAAILLVVGGSLFLGEWLLGSIGWGVLHGLLAFMALAVVCVVAAVGVSARRIGRALLGAVILAVVIGVGLGLDLPNRAYAAIGDALGLAIDPLIRPLVVGAVVGIVIGLILGLLIASRSRASYGPAAVGGAILGILLGAFSAITFAAQVGAGVGIAIGYIAWMAILGADVAMTGIDVDALKRRFYPTQTIATSKETLEWLQKRMPPGIG